MSDAEPSWDEAVTELEAILAELEGDLPDVDRVADRVRRAGVLIKLCRDRIGGARTEVEQIVASIETGDQTLLDPPD